MQNISKKTNSSALILNRKRKGFTLIELIVVIAIIGILVLLAMPKFMDYTRDAKDAKTQHDARVAEDAVTEHLIGNDDKLPEGLTGVTPGDIQDAIDEGRAYDTEGPVAEVPDGPYVDVTDIEEVKAGGIKTDGKIISNNNGDVFILLDKAIRTDVCVLRADQKFYVNDYVKIDEVYNSPNYENAEAVKAKYPTVEFYKFTQDGKSFIGFFTNNDKKTREVTLVDYYGDGTSVIVPGEIAVKVDSHTTDVHTVIASDVQNVIDPSVIVFELPCTVTGSMTSGDAGDAGDAPTVCESKQSIPDGWVGVYTAEDLNGIRNNLSVNYIQMADIDLSTYAAGEGWAPIGSWGNFFTGDFDGNCYTINNLTINRPSTDAVGLFGATERSEIKNVTINNSDIIGGDYVGTLIGESSFTNLQNITIESPRLTGGWGVGGVIGWEYGGGNPDGVIFHRNLIVTDLDIYGNSIWDVGGLYGGTSSNTHLVNASVTGTIALTGNSGDIGGIIGCAQSNFVINAFTDVDITGSEELGGLFGYADDARIYDSYAIGDISGYSNIGGITGSIYEGQVKNSYYEGTITASGSNVGGIVGYIKDYNAGYSNYPSVVNSYSNASIVSSGSNVGGLVGLMDNGIFIEDSYYVGGPINGIGVNISVSELASEGSFANWDFVETWSISENKPTLVMDENNLALIEGHYFYKSAGDIILYVGNGGDIAIPDTFVINSKSYPVKGISWGAYQSTPITGITIPNTVEYIDKFAFARTNITSLTIPEGIDYISSYIAYKSSYIAEINLPDSVKAIGFAAFANDPNHYSTPTPRGPVKSLVLPGQLEYIGGLAFEGNSLELIVIPNNVTTIGYQAFSNNKIMSISLEGSVQAIGNSYAKYAFSKNGANSNSTCILAIQPTGPWTGNWNISGTTWIKQ